MRTCTRRWNSEANISFMSESYIVDSNVVKDYHSGAPTLQKVNQQSRNFHSLRMEGVTDSQQSVVRTQDTNLKPKEAKCKQSYFVSRKITLCYRFKVRE